MTEMDIKEKAEKPKYGKQVLNFLITETNRRILSQYLKDRARTKMIRQVSREDETHLEEILNICLKHVIPLKLPIALISQVPCSGGSLLSQLLDGHPQLHAYPGALICDHTRSEEWPQIDLSCTPQEWLNDLSGHFDLKTLHQGFKADETDIRGYPHIYLPILQERIFLKYLSSLATIEQRDVFDAWMKACFGAWLNYQNHGQDKKFITAFAPGLTVQVESVKSFFEIYPGGRLIALIREPAQWYAAVSRREPQLYGSIEGALERWREYTVALVETRKKMADRICLIEYQDLMNSTEGVMRHLADFLRISYEKSLLVPTFNGNFIENGTSQISNSPEGNHRRSDEIGAMDKNQKDLIEDITAADYQTALQLVVSLD